jgi:hypothetical protein
LVNPAAFGRAERARRYIRHVVAAMKLANPWQYEMAAMLSQLGCVTLAPETIDAIYKGETLTPNEQAQYAAHPSVAYDLLSKIPRLEPIAWMVEHQNGPIPPEVGDESADIRHGAEILRTVLTYESFIHKGFSRTETMHRLSRLNPKPGPELFNALVALNPQAEDEETRHCPIEELAPGMIIQQEIRGVDGTLIISKGQEITPTVIFRLKNLHARRAIPGRVTVSVPTVEISSAAASP